MFVRNAMTKSVVTLNPDITVKEGTELMSKENMGSIIVMKGGKITGIVTERDIINKVVAKGLDVNKTSIGEIMTRNVIKITSGDRLDKACKIMDTNNIKKLPVVDDGKLIGILTTTDIVAYEPKLAGYIYRLITSKESEITKKRIRTILFANILLVWMLITYSIIFTVFLSPILSLSGISTELIITLYFFIIFSTVLSSAIGFISYKLLPKKS